MSGKDGFCTGGHVGADMKSCVSHVCVCNILQTRPKSAQVSVSDAHWMK
ncbi:hypothetical protein [Methanohalobium evestigatum]|nr:hypothetical protein [Methanohalobium evestigatum]